MSHSTASESGRIRLGRLPIVAQILFLICISGCRQKLYFYNCLSENEIGPAERSAIEATSLDFARAVLDGTADRVRTYLTDATNAQSRGEQILEIVQSIRSAKAYSGLQLNKVTVVKIRGSNSDAFGTVVCSGNPSSPDGNIALTVQNLPEQAYSIVSVQTSQETWSIVLWLVPQHGKWRVNGFHVLPNTLLGKSPKDIAAVALLERERLHRFNAAVLYNTSTELASRGPFYHIALEDVIQRERNVSMKPDLSRGPFELSSPQGSFNILRIDATGVDGKLFIRVVHQVAPWKDPVTAEQRNQLLIAAIATQFPEFSTVFQGIVAEAVTAGNERSWQTFVANSRIPEHHRAPR